MGTTYFTSSHTTKNKIDVGTEVNTYFDEGLKALAEAQEKTAIIAAGMANNIKKEAKKLYEITLKEQSSFNNKLFDAAKIIVLVIFLIYMLNYYNRKGKKNG